MKVGDLVRREYEADGYGVGVILELFRRDGNVPGAPWTAKVHWSGWWGIKNVETQELEVISEAG